MYICLSVTETTPCYTVAPALYHAILSATYQFKQGHIAHIQWSLHYKTIHPARKKRLKLQAVLKWRDIYIENIRVMSLAACLKIEGTVKWRGLKSQGPLYIAVLNLMLAVLTFSITQTSTASYIKQTHVRMDTSLFPKGYHVSFTTAHSKL